MLEIATDDRLLRAIVEQLKLPLLQIARTAELANSSAATPDLVDITNTADAALRLLDGYLLGVGQNGQQLFPLEPVSLASVLHNVAHQLEPLAKRNNCELDLSIAGRYGPVMAHAKSLESALLLLGQGIVETRGINETRHRVVLAVHRNKQGLVAGVFDNQPGLTTDMWRRGKALYGDVRQPMPKVLGSNGANIFVADMLFRSMASTLRVAKHHNFTGLAAMLHPSTQLSLV